MKMGKRRHLRILAIAPSSRGFGFAVLEGENKLLDWGVKVIRVDKNPRAIKKVRDLIVLYSPGCVVLEDAAHRRSRRSSRIRVLSEGIVSLGESCEVTVALLSRDKVMRKFFANGNGTKDALAKTVADRFPDELRSRLPPRRRPWMSEDYRMGIFDAVALALAL